MAESPGRLQRTKWAKRRQRILSAVGGAVAPAVRVQLRQGACCGRRGFSRTPQATHNQPLWARMERAAGVLRPWPARETLKNVGDPRSSYTGAATGEGRQLLRHSRGNPETAPCWHRRAATHQGRGRRRRRATGTPTVCGWGVVSSVVLGGGESPPHGAGLDGSMPPERTRIPDMADRNRLRQPPCGPEPSGFCPARMRVQPRNRMRENCTSGSARGASGNRRPYRGGWVPPCEGVFPLRGKVGTPLALDAPQREEERGQIAQALQREFRQQDQICPLRVWSLKGHPWFRRHRDSSMAVAAAGLTRKEVSARSRHASRPVSEPPHRAERVHGSHNNAPQDVTAPLPCFCPCILCLTETRTWSWP